MRDAEKALKSEVEALSDACFTFLVSNHEALRRFMEETGYEPEALGDALGTRALDMAMLEFFVRSEPLLKSLCACHNLIPERVTLVWQRLNPQF